MAERKEEERKEERKKEERETGRKKGRKEGRKKEKKGKMNQFVYCFSLANEEPAKFISQTYILFKQK